jgi:hypothetical protein
MTLADLTVGTAIGGLLACLVVGITLVASWPRGACSMAVGCASGFTT